MVRNLVKVVLFLAIMTGLNVGTSSAETSQGPGIISYSAESTSDDVTAIIRAYYLGPGFLNLADNIGFPSIGIDAGSPLAHEWAAYLWGYEVGDPEVIASMRLMGEIGQFVFFTVVPSQYDPSSIYGNGGLLDSWNDIQNSLAGAYDRLNGLPANPAERVSSNNRYIEPGGGSTGDDSSGDDGSTSDGGNRSNNGGGNGDEGGSPSGGKH